MMLSPYWASGAYVLLFALIYLIFVSLQGFIYLIASSSISMCRYFNYFYSLPIFHFQTYTFFSLLLSQKIKTVIFSGGFSGFSESDGYEPILLTVERVADIHHSGGNTVKIRLICFLCLPTFILQIFLIFL